MFLSKFTYPLDNDEMEGEPVQDIWASIEQQIRRMFIVFLSLLD